MFPLSHEEEYTREVAVMCNASASSRPGHLDERPPRVGRAALLVSNDAKAIESGEFVDITADEGTSAAGGSRSRDGQAAAQSPRRRMR
jgi:hypothetical protein